MIKKLPCHDEIVYEIQRAVQTFGPLTAQSLMKRCAQVTAANECESYVATIDTLNRISFALEDIEPEKNITSHGQISDDNLFNFEPSYDENYGFRFRFSRLPNLKSSRSLSRVSDRFAIEVAEKIVATIPKNFQKMSGANVIFVSHVLNDGPHKSRYFDNDNLAIKSILDIIVPYICIDDATRYCDMIHQ